MEHFDELFDRALWIAPEDRDAFPVIRASFDLARIPAKAMLHIVGFGGYVAYLNGQRVSEDLFLPLNTDFEDRGYPSGEETGHRILCDSYPVSALLRTGKNVLAVLLGRGWYTGVPHEKPFGDKKLCFRLWDAESGDTLAVSDLTARWAPSFVTAGEFTRGEVQDFTDWEDAALGTDHDDSLWPTVIAAPAPDSRYFLSDCPRDRVTEVLTPTLLYRDEEGALYDAGCNLSGYPVLRGRSGRVTVRVSEILDESGRLSEFYGHKQYLDYTVGREPRLLYPRFCWLGFRYFYVTGDCEVVAVHKTHTDVAPTSAFDSDNEVLNWIHRAFINTQLCNMHNGIPSDCPQIERRGYTGDGQLVCRAVMRTLDAKKFYRKWLDDIADCQDRISGHVQYTAPYTHSGGGPGGWGSAIVTVPYEYWRMYGDETPMREMFDGMLEYFRYLEDHSDCDLVTSDRAGEWCLGDWCVPHGVILPPPPFVNNYFYIKSMQRVIEIARVIGRGEVISTLEARIAARKRVLLAAYYNQKDGDFLGNIQGANAFALDIGLGDDRAFEHLAARYERETYYDTGIFGTDIVTRLLFERGRGDLAVRLLCAAEPHGFGRWMREGSTTLWEYFDYWRNGVTRSYSHPMFGAVVAYFYEYLLGITQPRDAVGYERVRISPMMIDGLDRVSGHMTVPRGVIGVSYVREGGRLHLTVEIPDGVSAEVVLPDGEMYLVEAGVWSFDALKGSL